VLDGHPAPPEKNAQPPPNLISAHFYCGQTAVGLCIRIGLSHGTEVGLSLGDIVLDREPRSPSPKGAQPPNFRPISVVAKRLDGLIATWYGDSFRPKRLCVRWAPSSPRKKGTAPNQFSSHVYCSQTAGWIKTPLRKGHSNPPPFRPMSMWPRSPISTTAELLYKYKCSASAVVV